MLFGSATDTVYIFIMETQPEPAPNLHFSIKSVNYENNKPRNSNFVCYLKL